MPVTAISMPQSAPRPVARSHAFTTVVAAALEALCRQIEAECPGVFAAVHVLGRSRRRWAAVIAPTMPEAWRLLHRAPSGPAAGACGMALVRRRRVIVTDVAADAGLRSTGAKSDGTGMGACWATPLLGATGEPRGVLALCVARGGRPLRRETRAMDRAAELATLLLEHAADLGRTGTQLASAERLAGSGAWIADARTAVLLWSNEMFHLWGLDPDGPQPTLEAALARVHEDDAERVRSSIEESLRSRGSLQGECRLVRPDGSIVTVRYLGRPVFGRSGELLEYGGTVRDITDERRVHDRLQTALDELRSLSARQTLARDDERRRIARHLHETTVQDLAAIRLNLAGLVRHAEAIGSGAASLLDASLLEESIALAERSMADLRTLSYSLHPPLLEEAGLESALRWYAAGFAKRSGIDVRLDLPSPMDRLPQEVETTVFRSVQECLINVHRHARSRAAAVRVRVTEGRLVTEVQDWGRGMPAVLERPADGGRGLGVGIAGMRERLQQLGGALEIESSDAGTTVRAVLPVGSAA